MNYLEAIAAFPAVILEESVRLLKAFVKDGNKFIKRINKQELRILLERRKAKNL